MLRYTLTLIALATAAVSAVAADDPRPIEPEAVSLGRPVDYAQDVAPIFEANCTACHNVAIDESGLSLEEVAAMLKGGDRGPAIVPGKPEESLLLAVASHKSEPLMPPPDNEVEARPLTPRELGLIRQWILEGAAQGEGTPSRTIAWQAIPSHLRAIRSVALSPQNRFVAIGRGNQLELYDLAFGRLAQRLVDPNLASIRQGDAPLYPHGAADRDLVQSLAFHPAGRLLASGGYRSVKLWRRTGLGDALPIDAAGATALAVTIDGKTAAIAVGQEIRLITMADGKVAATHALPAKPIALAFSVDGAILAAGCEDKSLSVWQIADGKAAHSYVAPATVTAVALAGAKLVSAHEDGVLRVWSSESAAPERELKGHTGPVRFVAVLAGHENAVVSAGEDGTLRLWDVSTDNQTRSIEHGSPVSAVAVSPDGKTIVSCGGDGSVRFWNVGDGKKLGERTGLLTRHQAAREAQVTHEWRKQLAGVADARVKAAEAAVKDREEIHKKAAEAKAAAEKALAEAKTANDAATAAAKAAVEAAAAKPDDAALKKQSEEAGKKAAEAQGKLTAADAALKSAERSVMLGDQALQGAQARLVEAQSQKAAADEAVKAAEAAATAAAGEAGKSPAVTFVAFSPSGAMVAVGYADGVLQTFTATGQPLDEMQVEPGTPSAAGMASEDSLLTLSSQGTVARIDLAGRWEYAGVLGPPAESPLELSRSVFSDRVLALAFSPDGSRLATGGGEPSRGGEALLWNVEERQPVRTIAEPHSDTVQALAFSHDGRLLATAGADKFAKLFEAESGELVRAFEGHTDQVLGIAVKADGTELATASADLGVKVWDVQTGEQRRTIGGYGKQVTAVRYVGLTDEIVTSAGDKTVRLHRTSNGQQVRVFGGAADYVHAVAISDDGSIVAAGGEDGTLFVWDGTDGKIRHKFDPTQPETTTASK